MGRDLLRWLVNILIGPPLGFLFCILTMMFLLVFDEPGEMQSRIDGAIIFALFAIPFVFIAYVFGILPGILVSIAGTIFDRLFRASRAARLVGMLLAGGLATYACDVWLFGRTDYPIQVGSQDLFFASVVVGGAIGTLVCALLVEWITPIRRAVARAVS